MSASDDETLRPAGQPPVPVGLLGGTRRLIGPLRVDHLRFGLIGLYNTGFSFAVFASLTLAFSKVSYIAVLLVSHVLGVLNAYLAYRIFVFQVHGRWFRDLFRFWLVYLSGLGVNLVALPFLVEVVGMPVLLGQLCVVVVTALSSWFGHKHVSFRRPAADRLVEAVSQQS